MQTDVSTPAQSLFIIWNWLICHIFDSLLKYHLISAKTKEFKLKFTLSESTNSPCKPDSSWFPPNTSTAFTPAITLPVSVAQLSQPGKSCQVLQALVFGTRVSVRLSPDFFSTLGMLSLPVTEAQRVSSLSTSVNIRLSSASPLCVHTVAFSSAELCCCCCCCTVRRNTELQVDQKLLQHTPPCDRF